MSSYQFVNSLAACYGQQGGRTGASPVEPANPQDFYNPNGQNPYPNCYSPQQGHYSQQYNGHEAMMDYTQLHSQGHRLGLNPGGSGSPTPPLINNNTILSTSVPRPAAASCKYADPANPVSKSGGVSSPQDLSTGPSRSPVPTKQPATQTAVGGVSPAAPARHATSPASAGGQTTSSTVSQSSASPASSTSSTSTGGGGGGGNATNSSSTKGGSSSNPPQIYPWMKRVHLGTSK